MLFRSVLTPSSRRSWMPAASSRVPALSRVAIGDIWSSARPTSSRSATGSPSMPRPRQSLHTAGRMVNLVPPHGVERVEQACSGRPPSVRAGSDTIRSPASSPRWPGTVPISSDRERIACCRSAQRLVGRAGHAREAGLDSYITHMYNMDVMVDKENPAGRRTAGRPVRGGGG